MQSRTCRGRAVCRLSRSIRRWYLRKPHVRRPPGHQLRHDGRQDPGTHAPDVGPVTLAVHRTAQCLPSGLVGILPNLRGGERLSPPPLGCPPQPQHRGASVRGATHAAWCRWSVWYRSNTSGMAVAYRNAWLHERLVSLASTCKALKPRPKLAAGQTLVFDL